MKWRCADFESHLLKQTPPEIVLAVSRRGDRFPFKPGRRSNALETAGTLTGDFVTLTSV